MILLALETIHDKGQVHRNISASHILITDTVLFLSNQACLSHRKWFEKEFKRTFWGEYYYLAPEVLKK